MIKAGAGLYHAYFARGLVPKHMYGQQPFVYSPRLCVVHPASNSLLLSSGFRDLHSNGGRDTHGPACGKSYNFSKTVLKHAVINSLWSFENGISHFDHIATLLSYRGFQTSSKNKTTTSDLIKSLKLSKNEGTSASTTRNTVAATGHVSSKNKATTSDSIKNLSISESEGTIASASIKTVASGHERSVEEGKCISPESSTVSGKVDRDLSQGVSRAQEPLSSFIPQHVVDTGYAKKKEFSERQNQPRLTAYKEKNTIELRDWRKNKSYPVLNLESIRNESNKSPTPHLEVDAVQEDQKDASVVLKVSCERKRGTTSESTNRKSLLAAAFDVDPSAKALENSDFLDSGLVKKKMIAHGSMHEESMGNKLGGETIALKQEHVQEEENNADLQHIHFCNKNAADIQSYEGTTFSSRETIDLAGKPLSVINTNSQQPGHERDFAVQGVFGGDTSSKLVSNRSTQSDIDRMSGIKLSTRSTPSKETVDSYSKQDEQFVMRKVNAFNRWLAEGSQSENSMEAASSKCYDRNRHKQRKKNEVKEKDLSVKPIPGEPHYEFLIRRKQVRAEVQKALIDDVDDYEHVGDDWVRKRLGWLCKEIPVLKASGLVKMLNNQRKWIKQEHLKELIEHLIRYMELNRAHRVLKWMQQQPFYEFEYDLHNNMAFILGRNDKVSRCQDVFDEIVRNGQFPDASSFTALIKAYLHKGDQGDINDAWKLYLQMLQLGMEVSESLSEELLMSLTCPTGRWIRQIDELLEKMKTSGMHINEKMYGRVLEVYGKRGDHKKVDATIDEMRKHNLKMTLGILNSRIEACVKNGDIKKAEHTLEEIIELGFKPDWHSYAYLIQVYGKANSPVQAWEVFEKMKGIGLPMNFATYQATIDAMAADGQHINEVMQVLSEVEKSGIKPLQPCYNSVMNMFLRLEKYDEVESIYKRGKEAKVRPAHAAYNMLMQAYVATGKLENAEALFQEMKKTEGIGPNTRTYNILLEGYGTACMKGRARELFEEMTEKGCQLDADVKVKVQSLISAKRIANLEKKKLVLTDEQREIIPGLLLGGARMESPDNNRTYELHLEFKCEDEVKKVIKDRLSFLFQAWWKPNQTPSLNQLTATKECEDVLAGASAIVPIVRLETVSHGSFRFYAHQYRPKGEPVIPKLIHRWLKPRTLAYWYMYGGRKCERTGGIILNASKYSGKQLQLVIKALKARTIDCRRRKKRNGDVIRFEGKSAMWLWKLMEPYILKSVKEQLRPEESPVDSALAKGTRGWDYQGQENNDESEGTSDEDDWDDLGDEVEMTT